MLHESILQYFRPSLNYDLSLRALFCLSLISHLRQVLLYLLKHTVASTEESFLEETVLSFMPTTNVLIDKI